VSQGSKYSAKRNPQGRSRTRTGSPAEFRSWVTEHTPEKIRSELLRRVQNLSLAKPLWVPILGLTRQLASTTLQTMDFSVELPPLSAEQGQALTRHAVANIAAEYWRHHEYRGGILLPPIQTVGVPWEVAQDRIHVLDLPPQAIKVALAATRRAARSFRQSRGRNLKDPITRFHFQVSAALITIGQLGPWALGSSLPLLTLLRCLILARDSPHGDEALMAAEAADTLLDALRPDLSRRMTRTPYRLRELWEQFVETHKAVSDIHDRLVSSGPNHELLARARKLSGTMLTAKGLRCWQSMSPVVIARQLVARELRCSDKVLRDCLALAGRLADTNAAWTRFLAYLKTLPANQQRQLVTALPVLVPLEPEQPPATTA